MQKIEGMSFSCKNIGMDCSYEINGSTSQELMKNFIDHAETTHKMQFLPAELIFKVQKAIKSNLTAMNPGGS